jgi:hypothetical protein
MPRRLIFALLPLIPGYFAAVLKMGNHSNFSFSRDMEAGNHVGEVIGNSLRQSNRSAGTDSYATNTGYCRNFFKNMTDLYVFHDQRIATGYQYF